MEEIKDMFRVLIRTADGLSVVIWFFIYILFFLKSVIFYGFHVENLKFLFFPVVLFLVFARFRTNLSGGRLETNYWGFVNVNVFGVVMLMIGE